MGRRKARSGGLRGRTGAIVATLAAIGILYLIVRAAAAAVNPAAAAALPPREHSRLLRAHLYGMLLPGGRVSPEILALVRKTALAEPLSFEPFFVAAVAAERRGRLDEAIRLMEEARRRRRSFALTRLQLASYYARAGRFADGLRELELVLVLRQEALEPVMVELAKLIPLPEGRRVLADALARNPAWRPAFFSFARAQGVRPDDAAALLREVRARSPRADLSLERQLFVTALINDGQLRRARDLWLGSLPAGERSRHALMGNPRFEGQPVPAPFGWTLSAVDVGRAEVRDTNTPRPFLYVDYFGGSNAVLAEQLLALPPGAYRLRFEAAGEGASGSSTVAWTLACASGSPQLLRADLRSVAAPFRPFQAGFTVPASGCGGQRLRLIGEAGDMPSTVALRIRGLEVVQ